MANPTARSRWLFGPGPDLLLGAGGAYALLFAALVVSGDAVQAALPFGLLPLLVLVTSIPHYGGTLLRVYERSEDRKAYRLFAVWAAVAVYAWFAVGVYDVGVGSWLVTLYLTWSPWHYSGQNYGIALMLLGRRGVRVDAAAKRPFYLSFLFCYAIAFLGSHATGQGATYAPGSLEGVTYRFVRLGISQGAFVVLLGATASAYLVALGVSLWRLRRAASWRVLAPALAIVALQALWFSIPVLSRATGVLAGLTPFDPELAEYSFLWIAIAHAVQYLWVTSYYALSTRRAERAAPYYGKSLLAGGAMWGVPLLLFGPDLLGVRAFDAGLGLLAAAAVNLHHFILDGAIWKLRDGRIARILLRPADPARPPPAAGAMPRVGPRALRGGVAALGVLYAVTEVAGRLEYELAVRPATQHFDAARLHTAATRLRWLGRDHPDIHYNLGVHATREGRLDVARRALERSLALRENAPSWLALGIVEQRAGRPDRALEAFDAALAVDPRNVPALVQSSRLLAESGRSAEARARLERAVEAAPDRADLRRALAAL